MMFRSGLALALTAVPLAGLADPLPSWNDTATEQAIIAFVESVTDPDSDDFVPERDRIAVFDNDGTLWSEQPLYFQGAFAFDVLRERAAADPSILTSDVLTAANAGDFATVAAAGDAGLLEVLNVAHANISVDDFQALAYDWVTTTQHPTSGLTYAEMTYQPMVELLMYLRDNGFRTYIVSGGGTDFMRAFAEEAYGIPPWQVIGSRGDTTYELVDGVPVLWKNGGVSFVDDTVGKPVGIITAIGQRPIFAAGNSDGDFQMLEYTTAGEGPSLGIIVHHTDAAREWAYDREGQIGVLNRGLDDAAANGWILVDMANDWSRIWTGSVD